MNKKTVTIQCPKCGKVTYVPFPITRGQAETGEDRAIARARKKHQCKLEKKEKGEMYLYEEHPVDTLPLDLAYSIPYIVEIDLVCGTEIVTFKPVRVWNN